MLVLSRSTNEVVQIGPDCTVRVLEIRGCKVSLGITAPGGTKVLREELLTLKQRQKLHREDGSTGSPRGREEREGNADHP